MLKDPVFDISKKTLEWKNEGIFFNNYLIQNVLDSRKIPCIVTMADTTSAAWKHVSSNLLCKLSLYAKHSTGIFLGWDCENFINRYSDSEILSDVASFDLSSGEYYTYAEQHELFTAVYHDRTKTTGDLLSNGKVIRGVNNWGTSYGIADNITQVLKHYRRVIMRTDFDVCIHIQHFNENQGRDSKWHKQGKYLGKFKHKHELIGDDVEFGSFISFNVYVYNKVEE